jgi:hypothetical protein
MKSIEDLYWEDPDFYFELMDRLMDEPRTPSTWTEEKFVEESRKKKSLRLAEQLRDEEQLVEEFRNGVPSAVVMKELEDLLSDP